VTSSAGIVVVGSLNRDYTCRVDRLPDAGETRLGDELTLSCGGKGGNQAVAAALLGGAAGITVAMVGAVGDDEDGVALRAALTDADVDVAGVSVRASVRSGAALITVAGDGENTIVVAPGANATLTEQDVATALRRHEPSVVVTQGELTAEIVAATVRTAGLLAARVVLNLAPVLTLDPSVMRLCDPLVVNESEAAELLGRRGLADPAAAARDLARTARSAVVTAGADGVYVAVDGQVEHLPTEQVRAVDTSGAGDAFTGAVAVALAAGLDVTSAAAHGCTAGAYAVTRVGAQLTPPLDLRLDLTDRRHPT
jgi:ribokinase